MLSLRYPCANASRRYGASGSKYCAARKYAALACPHYRTRDRRTSSPVGGGCSHTGPCWLLHGQRAHACHTSQLRASAQQRLSDAYSTLLRSPRGSSTTLPTPGSRGASNDSAALRQRGAASVSGWHRMPYSRRREAHAPDPTAPPQACTTRAHITPPPQLGRCLPRPGLCHPGGKATAPGPVASPLRLATAAREDTPSTWRHRTLLLPAAPMRSTYGLLHCHAHARPAPPPPWRVWRGVDGMIPVFFHAKLVAFFPI